MAAPALSEIIRAYAELGEKGRTDPAAAAYGKLAEEAVARLGIRQAGQPDDGADVVVFTGDAELEPVELASLAGRALPGSYVVLCFPREGGWLTVETASKTLSAAGLRVCLKAKLMGPGDHAFVVGKH